MKDDPASEADEDDRCELLVGDLALLESSGTSVGTPLLLHAPKPAWGSPKAV